MPCNSDHCEPTKREHESRIIMLLLEEVGMHNGVTPYYGIVSNLDRDTSDLCNFCQNNKLDNYSLELQIWCRDHQEADKSKLILEQNAIKEEQEKKDALLKLTGHERTLLGL